MAARGDREVKCKYCDAAVSSDADDIIQFECNSEIHDHGTADERFYWSAECADAFRERFDAMFPVPPWSTDAITSGTCESLNMHRSDDGYSYSIVDYVYVHQTMDDTWRVSFRGYTDRGMTAGQLACLVAARRAST